MASALCVVGYFSLVGCVAVLANDLVACSRLTRGLPQQEIVTASVTPTKRMMHLQRKLKRKLKRKLTSLKRNLEKEP